MDLQVGPSANGLCSTGVCSDATTEATNYQQVKAAVLRRYNIDEIAYQSRLRTIKKGESKSFREELAVRIWIYWPNGQSLARLWKKLESY